MSKVESSKPEVQSVTVEMFEELVARVAQIEAKLNAPKVSPTEMTDADAEKILSGEFHQLKHKEAAEKLGLTYGQVYSARMGFTFKHIVKKLKDAGVKNQWVK
jgi:DNA-directed RNA polymerase specialized sigma24 family protein